MSSGGRRIHRRAHGVWGQKREYRISISEYRILKKSKLHNSKFPVRYSIFNNSTVVLFIIKGNPHRTSDEYSIANLTGYHSR